MTWHKSVLDQYESRQMNILQKKESKVFQMSWHKGVPENSKVPFEMVVGIVKFWLNVKVYNIKPIFPKKYIQNLIKKSLFWFTE